MGLLDIILGLLLAYGLYKGVKNGLFLEAAAIIALIAGIYGAIHFSYITADYLSVRVSWELRTLKLAAFIITFLLIVGIVHLLGKALTKVADIAFVGWLNKLAGGIFGLLKAAVILGALLIFFDRANSSLNVVKSDYIADSILYAPLVETGAFVFDWVLEPDRRKPSDFSSED